ncbi:MAG: cation diffusion facilitator family transporter [Planctomycetes bacterium]|nr:cation diffusion facilitator family transporter [Planctomycetota bacterium]
MADASSKSAVFTALICNCLLSVFKFVAFAFSGSGSMLSEAIHTLADAGNQFLLFLGIKKSEQPANTKFHYGFGYERFLYALMSAAGIFILGCGVTVYHGAHSLYEHFVEHQHHELKIGWLDFAVLGLGFCMDGFVLLKAVQAVKAQKGNKGFFEFLRTSSDPTILAVLFEDSVACIGVVIALIGIILSMVTHSPVFDALGSICIGLLLGWVAIWLAMKNRALLLGKSIPQDVELQMIAWIQKQPTVEKVHAVQSRVVGADIYKLKAEVDFNGAVLADALTGWVEEQQTKLTTPEARAAFTREFGEKLMQAHGAEINRIEDSLRREFPQLKYIDLESD